MVKRDGLDVVERGKVESRDTRLDEPELMYVIGKQRTRDARVSAALAVERDERRLGGEHSRNFRSPAPSPAPRT